MKHSNSVTEACAIFPKCFYRCWGVILYHWFSGTSRCLQPSLLPFLGHQLPALAFQQIQWVAAFIVHLVFKDKFGCFRSICCECLRWASKACIFSNWFKHGLLHCSILVLAEAFVKAMGYSRLQMLGYPMAWKHPRLQMLPIVSWGLVSFDWIHHVCYCP